MMNRKEDKLAAALRFIYGHFLEEGETLADFMESRVQPRPNIRHIVRKRLYRHLNVTYKQIGEAEASVKNGQATDDGAIGYSVRLPEEMFANYDRADRVMNQLIEEFEDYWLNNRLRHYYRMPHHVLAVIVCFAENFGYADRRQLDRLYDEFHTVSEGFVEQQIN